MSKPKTTYFEKEDILHLLISDEPESDSIELSPNITAELNDKSELIGIEILNASAFIRDRAYRLGWNRVEIQHSTKNIVYTENPKIREICKIRVNPRFRRYTPSP